MNCKYKAVVFDYMGVLEFSHGGNPLVIASEALLLPFEDIKEVYF